MATTSRYYTLIGFDKTVRSLICEDYRLVASLYDLKSSTPETPIAIANSSNGNVLRSDASSISGLLNSIYEWACKKAGCVVYNFKVYTGTHLESTDLSVIFKTISFLECDYRKDERKAKTITYRDNTRNLKQSVIWKIAQDTVMPFDLNKGFSSWTGSIGIMVKEAGIDSVCKRVVTTQKLVRNYIKDSFSKEDIMDSNAAGDAVIFDRESGMNIGGRFVAREPRKVHKFVSFDVNSLYSNIMLTEKFSYTRLLKLFRVLPSMRDLDPISERFVKTIKFLNSNNLRCRILCRVHRVSIKNKDDGMSISRELLLDGSVFKTLPNSSWLFAGININFMIFGEEFLELIQKYNVEGLEVGEIYLTRTSKLPQKVREKILQTYLDVERAKASHKTPEEIEFRKLRKNNVAGYFQYFGDLSNCNIRDMSFKYIYGASKTAQARGMMLNPYVGAEITLMGREYHRYLEDYFISHGYKVIYGNTDSIYIEVEDEEDESNLYQIQKQFNKDNLTRIKEACSDLPNWDRGIDYTKLPGAIKYEHSGYMIHNGVNNMLTALGRGYEAGLITGGTMSGVKLEDLRPHLPNLIEDMEKGLTVENFPFLVIDKNGKTSHIEHRDWVF